MTGMRVGVAILAIAVVIAALLVPRAMRAPDAPRASNAGVTPSQATDSAPEEAAPLAATPSSAIVAGTVSGRYGPIAAVPLVALADGEVVAETVTDISGRYRLEVPVDRELEVEARPMPETLLAPARRAALPAAGEELTLDFELAPGSTARGVLRGGGHEPLNVVAIRAEEYPLGSDPPTIGALEAAPKLGAQVTVCYRSPEDARRFSWQVEVDTVFTLDGLDPAATYRLAVLDRGWALDGAVLFRGGDSNISARVSRVLRIFVEANDAETREPLLKFRVSLANGQGTILETFEGADGRLSRCLYGDHGNPDEIVVSADGFLDETCPSGGLCRVALQRARPPNVLVRIAYDDGIAYDGEVTARFESIEDPDGFGETAVQKDGPGRFRATLPAGKWRLHVSRPHAFHDVPQVADVEVHSEGTAETELRYHRGGTVTFEADMHVEREVDGDWQHLCASKGTWEDVPSGTYRVMDGEKEISRFEVGPRTTWSVRAPSHEREEGD